MLHMEIPVPFRVINSRPESRCFYHCVNRREYQIYYLCEINTSFSEFLKMNITDKILALF